MVPGFVLSLADGPLLLLNVLVTELSGFNHFPCSFLMFVKCYPLLVGANPYDSPRYSGDSIKRYNASTSETLIHAQGRSDEMLRNL